MSVLVAITVFPPLVPKKKNHSEYILFKKHGKGFNIFEAKSYEAKHLALR